MNDYDAAVANSLTPNPAQSARAGFAVAADTNPEAYAEAQRVARRTGVPVDTVFAQPDEMKRQERMGSIDFDALAKTSPATAALLGDVEKAKIAHDDVDNLTGLESLLYNVGEFEVGTGKAIASSVLKANEGLFGLARAGAEVFVPEVLGRQAIVDYATQAGASQRYYADQMMPKSDNIVANSWYSGMQSLGLNALLLPLGVGGKLSPVLAAMGLMQGGQSYGEARDAKVPVLPSLAFAGSQGVIEAGTEMLGMPSLFSILKPGKFGQKALEYLVKDQGGEQIATHLQDLNEWATLNPDKPFSDYLAARPGAALQTALSTAFSGGGQVALMKGAEIIANRNETRVQNSDATVDLLARLNEATAASKVLARDPQTFEQHVAQATQDGPAEAVFINAQTLQQSGLADQLAELSPAIAEQYQAALQTGGNVRIPTSEYATNIAPTEYAQSLVEHLKFDPEGFSQAEAKLYMQTHAADLQAEVERVIGEQSQDDQWRQSAREVEDAVFGELQRTGRHTEEVNRTDAVLHKAFASVMAAKLGTTPMQFFNEHTLRVIGERVDGAQFDQSGSINRVAADNTPRQEGDNNGPAGASDAVDEATGLPLNADGTVTLYHHTSAGQADQIRKTGKLKASAEPDVYVTTRRETDTGYGDTAVPIRVDPSTLIIDDEFPDGRKDFRMSVGKPGGSIKVNIPHEPSASAGSDVFNQDANNFLALFDGADTINIEAPKMSEQEIDDEQRVFLSAFPKSVTTYRRQTGVARRLRRASDHAADIIGEDPSSPRTVESALGPFSSYEVIGEALPGDEQYNPGGVLKVRIYGKEQVEAGLMDEPALTFTVMRDGELSVNGPTPGGATFDAFVQRGWAEQSKAGDQVAEGWSNLKNPDGGKLPTAQAIGLLADVHARVRAWKMEDHVGLHWSRATGALAGMGDYGSAVFFQNTQGNRGSFNPATNTIALLNNADLSTFLHETGHFFLEVQTDVVNELQQAAAIHGADTLSEGERQILDDHNALLAWFGVKDQSAWNNLDFEEKRAYHEQFARGFESYLFEGKAPSIELHGVFQRFRAWLLNVYRDLKNLNVDLTADVRGVFDRMLATTEQIQLAEQSRSVLPLFESADQAGMTVDEFAAYQALGVDATNTGIEELQARGLRDMQWLRNARGRVLKQLQKEAAARRAEVRMEAKREVMSQPIYQAWDFLTRKIKADDKIAPIERPKSPPEQIDETMDSLFVAIAKLGGLNKSEVIETWGTDPADKPTSSVFGKPVWRAEGKGLSIGGMAESLAQYGYLIPDDNGKVDLADFERMFADELRGHPAYSNAYDPGQFADTRAGDQIANPAALTAGRIDRASLDEMGLPAEVADRLDALKMVKRDALHPDIIAEMFGLTSGDELLRKLAMSDKPNDEIEGLTDRYMLERYGDLSGPREIEKAADAAIHNDVRARMIATELNALAKATGKPKVLTTAAKQFASAMIARLRVRAIKPGQYANAEARAGKNATKASKAGDLATAAAEKRNQLIQNYATKAAYDAQAEVEKALRYLKKFDGANKGLDAEYVEQIDALLSRFDLRKKSNVRADKMTALAQWVESQRDQGLEPDIPPDLLNEAFRKSYKDMSVEEFRGLVDTVKQIEHLGRLKHTLLTAKTQRAYEAVRDEIVASIVDNGRDREANTRTPTTYAGRVAAQLKRFWASHIKAATWAHVMDGGKDGGPMWEYFIRVANERGDMETTLRADATAALSRIMAPVFALGKMGGNGQFFPGINRSLNREARIALALNVGNDGNLQRLLGGEGWTANQIMPVLKTLTTEEWAAVQAIWDHFESYRPQIAAKEKRVYGKEPAWVEHGSSITAALGIRGGYYPIKYDPAASQRAEEHADAEGAKRQMQGAYTSATTRRSFTKSRVEEVSGRPLLYTLSGVYSGVNDVIHDLAWHEWLIDTNRLLRSKTIDGAIRNIYGPEVKQQFKAWSQDIAEGDKGSADAVDMAVSRLRQGVSVAGLGFNVMSAAMQPLGITQSFVRVGYQWIGRGLSKYIAHPIDATKEANAKSVFMEERARTRFRELNELRNRVQDQSSHKEFMGHYAYMLMMRLQQTVDVPTWHGAYEKAIAEGNDEERAVGLADQAVIDSQGGGMTKDLSAIERGGPAQKLFTVFYSFMNTALNIGVAKGMTERQAGKLASDMAMLYVIPPMLGYFLKNALVAGDSGDDDMKKIFSKLAANQIDYLMGLMVVVREFGTAAKKAAGVEEFGRGYSGPAGVRAVSDIDTMATQINQGELDEPFRKAAINTAGSLLGLPSAQINRTVAGAKAIVSGETKNPAAIVFGFQKQR